MTEQAAAAPVEEGAADGAIRPAVQMMNAQEAWPRGERSARPLGVARGTTRGAAAAGPNAAVARAGAASRRGPAALQAARHAAAAGSRAMCRASRPLVRCPGAVGSDILLRALPVFCVAPVRLSVLFPDLMRALPDARLTIARLSVVRLTVVRLSAVHD